MVEANPPTPVEDGTEPRRLTVARGMGVVALAAVLFTVLDPGTALAIGLAVLLLVVVMTDGMNSGSVDPSASSGRSGRGDAGLPGSRSSAGSVTVVRIAGAHRGQGGTGAPVLIGKAVRVGRGSPDPAWINRNEASDRRSRSAASRGCR